MGNGDCGQSITLCLCCSFLPTLFPCSSVGSLPQDRVFHELLQCGSFLWTEVLQELLQHGFFPQGTVLQEWTTLAWVPHQPQFVSESLLPCGLCTGCILLQGISTCSSLGSSMGHGVDICSTVFLHGLQGGNLHYQGLLHGVQENLCSAICNTSSPSFFTDLGVCRLFHIFSLASLLTHSCCEAFFTLS